MTTKQKQPKEERLEKVVEWDEEPNYPQIYLGIFTFCLFLLAMILTWQDTTKTGVMIFIIIEMMVLTFTLSGLGSGRKVYWRRIK